jgi:ERCC4-type nuclease
MAPMSNSPATFPLTVLVDSNEVAHGREYRFENLAADAKDGGGQLGVRVRSHNLLWGDYSLDGFELAAVVERKTLGDLFGTLTEGRDRFEEEMRALAAYRFAAVVVEAHETDIFTRPPSQASPKSIHRTVCAFRVRYRPVQWCFAGERVFAEKLTFRLLERCFLETIPEKERKRSYRAMAART